MNSLIRNSGGNSPVGTVWALLGLVLFLFAVSALIKFDTADNAKLAQEFGGSGGIAQASDFSQIPAGFTLEQVELVRFTTLPPKYAEMAFYEGFILVNIPFFVFTIRADMVNNPYLGNVVMDMADLLSIAASVANSEFALNMNESQAEQFADSLGVWAETGESSIFESFVNDLKPGVFADMQANTDFFRQLQNTVAMSRGFNSLVQVDLADELWGDQAIELIASISEAMGYVGISDAQEFQSHIISLQQQINDFWQPAD